MATTVIRLAPTRIKASGTRSLAAGASADFDGSDSGGLRRQIVVTNLDATNPLKLCLQNGNSTPWATVFAGQALTFETSANLRVKNPSSTSAVSYEVGELFYEGSFRSAGAAELGSAEAAAGADSGSDGGGVSAGAYTPSGSYASGNER